MKVSIKKYAQALSATLKGEKDQKEIDKKIQNLLAMLIKGKRSKQIKLFEKEFKKEWLKANGQMEMNATLPYELTDEEKAALSKLLGEVFKKDILLNVKVDEKVIGGMKLEFEDSIIDATVLKNLEILKSELKY